ncbi:hypothetical protein ACHAQA_000690 [Verticillium albo-atrum]
MAAKQLTTEIQYLRRNELYRTEKPYSTDFEVEDISGARKSNYTLSPHLVTVNPISGTGVFSLDVHGFCVIRAAAALTPEEALSRSPSAEARYHLELEGILKAAFPEYSRFEPMDFVVRKRDKRFPADGVAIVEYEQPACLAHSDYSVNGALLQLSSCFPGQERHFEHRDYDMLKFVIP